MSDSTNELALDNQLCFALYSAHRAVMHAYWPLLKNLGLTYPQYITLLVLWEEPEESISVGAIGKRLRLDSGTLTPLLKRLEASGLVSRSRDADDERRVLVGLTGAGRDLRNRALAVPRKLASQVAIQRSEAQQLRQSLDDLIAVLDSNDSDGR